MTQALVETPKILKTITIKEADLGVQGIAIHLSLKTLLPAHKITLSNHKIVQNTNSTCSKIMMLRSTNMKNSI